MAFKKERGIRPGLPAETETETAETQDHPAETNVRKLRLDRKWSQWQLAEISRLSERTIQRIEAGGPLGVTAELALAGAFVIEVPDLYRHVAGDTEDFVLLRRILSGSLLLDLAESAVKGSYEVEDLRDDEIGLVREFVESLSVWVATWRDREPAERITGRHIFTSTIGELDARGLWVFAGSGNLAACASETGDREIKIGIFRSANPRIIQPRPLRQLGKEMCCIIVGVSPRDLDPRVVRPVTNA